MRQTVAKRVHQPVYDIVHIYNGLEALDGNGARLLGFQFTVAEPVVRPSLQACSSALFGGFLLTLSGI